MKGFFGAHAWQQQKKPLQLVTECGACGLHKRVKSPMMPVSGDGREKILIVAEAPGENEDERGVQLIGNAGSKLVQILDDLGIDMRRDCWLDNAIICRPTTKAGYNRKPSDKEVGYCHPHLIKTIQELQPEIIIPLGDTATRSIIDYAWKSGEVESISQWAGWQIPCAKLNTWICPTFHPSYLLHSQDKRENPVPEIWVRRHLRDALKLRGRPHRTVPNYREKVKKFFDVDEAAKALLMMSVFAGPKRPLAFDYETTMLKPDHPDGEIISCAVSDGDASIAFPWYGKVVEVMSNILKSGIPFRGANMQFEERWTWAILGHGVKNWRHCAILGAHHADCRHSITSVKFQAFVQLGAEDYDSHIDAYKKGKKEGSNTLNRMKEVPLPALLEYNGLDSLYEWMLCEKQERELYG